MDDFVYESMGGVDYERITNIGGIKTTICRNRFEVVCPDKTEVNEQQILQEFKRWLNKRKQDAMRESGDMPKEVS